MDLIGFIIGFILVQTDNANKGHLVVGLSLLGLMFVIVPLFLYMRYSKKQLQDFVYNKEEE